MTFVGGPLTLWPEEALGHEAWLLTPDETARLAVAPIPSVFQEIWPLSGFVVFIVLCSLAMLVFAEVFRKQERRLFSPLATLAPWIGPLAIRQGLAVMLGLSALGGLPRHGTEFWSVPTLMVPDMQIALAGDEWAWLAYAEFIIALCLFLGVLVRLSALALVTLVGFGFWVFGFPFLAYGPHFLAPALLLLLYGGGALSLDTALRSNKAPLATFEPAPTVWVWRLAMFLLGATFVYLGIAYKLNQPTLLIAILEHGDVPTFGLPLDLAALIMMLAELTAGALLALGLLVRPIAIFLISAFTFFAVTIGETPLFHANLYGTMLMLLMIGDQGLSRDRSGVETTIYGRNIAACLMR